MLDAFHSWQSLLAALAQVLLLAGALVVVRGRAARVAHESIMWSRFGRGITVLLLTAGLHLAGHLVQHLLGHPVDASSFSGLWGVSSAVGTLLGFGFIYQGVVGWNRTDSPALASDETLSGLSAVLAATALGNLVLSWWRPQWADWGVLEQQVWLLRLGCLLVLLGTIGTIAVIAHLVGDPRPWLLGVAVIATLVIEVVSVGSGTSPTEWALISWVILAAALAGCATMRPRRREIQLATALSVSNGMLLVLMISVSVLAVSSRLDPDRTLPSVIFALLSMICVSTRAAQLVRDLTDFAQARQDAMTDDLTGLGNRRALVNRLTEATAAGSSVGLLMMDLNGFKAINDRHGHQQGDEILRQCAKRFAARIAPSELLSRLGGDEFAVLLSHATLEDAQKVAHQLEAACRPPFQVDGRNLSVGISVGVAIADPAMIGGGVELLRRADTAMYWAKANRSGVATYDDDVDSVGRRREELTDDLKSAFGPQAHPDAADEFVVHYQPQICVASGAVVGVEALVRWQHPVLGLLGPDAFLDLIEEAGLMSALTTHVLRTSTSEVARWRRDGIRVRLAVNLSTSSLANPLLLDVLDELLAEGLQPSSLVLEITETMLMSDPAAALRTCAELTRRGLGLSIDDYGTGYSSLAYLGDLPATELKLDRSFTARLVGDRRIQAIVAGTIELGHRLGLRVVAEGVEDQDTLEVLQGMGCDESQGYLHSRPLPAQLIRNWLPSTVADPRVAATA